MLRFPWWHVQNSPQYADRIRRCSNQVMSPTHRDKTKNMRIWTGEALEKKTSLEALNTAPVLSHPASSQPSARGSRVRRALARALLALCIDRSNSTPNLLRPLPPYKHPIALAVLLFAALPKLLLPQERGLGEELDSSLLACGFVASSSFAMV